MRLIWTYGRFGWPLVAAIGFLSVSLIAADFAWRVLIVSFETFVMGAVLADGLLVLVMIGFYLVLCTRFRKPSVEDNGARARTNAKTPN